MCKPCFRVLPRPTPPRRPQGIAPNTRWVHRLFHTPCVEADTHAFFMFSLKHGSLLPCGSSSEYLNKPSTTHSDCTRKLHLFQAPETRDGKENDNDPDWPTVLRPTFSPIRDAKSETHVTCIGFLRETTKETECSTLQPHLHVTLKTWRFQNGRCKKKKRVVRDTDTAQSWSTI